MNFKRLLFLFALLILLLGLMSLLWLKMQDDKTITTLDKPITPFALPQLENPTQMLTENIFLGKVSLVHIWASWCASCQEELPLLRQLATGSPFTFIGVNASDTLKAAQQALSNGNPYAITLFDPQDTLSFQWGVTAIPDTFLVDKKGHLRYKMTGPLTANRYEEVLKPLLQQLNEEPASIGGIYEKLIHEIRCATCENQTIADSSTPIATDMRRWIAYALSEGFTESQIKDSLRQRYGDAILYSPPVNHYTWLLWGGPILLLIAMIALWRRIIWKQ